MRSPLPTHLPILALTGALLFAAFPTLTPAGEMLLPSSPHPGLSSTTASSSTQKKNTPLGYFTFDSINTTITLGGRAQLNVIYDRGQIATPNDFVTAAIVTGNDPDSPIDDRRTSVLMNSTRLIGTSHTDFGNKNAFLTYASADFQGKSRSRSPNIRLRQLYGEFQSPFLGGSLRVGQAWTIFTDATTWPDTLDLEGPGSSLQLRRPLVCYYHDLADHLQLLFALEQRNNQDFDEAFSTSRWPDGVLATVYDDGTNRVKAAAILRDLRAENERRQSDRTLGWGLNATGRVTADFLPEGDLFTFGAAGGAGIGSIYDDSPPDGVFDTATGTLEALPVFGYYIGYQHFWTPKWSSTASYAALRIDNEPTQTVDALSRTKYFSANIIWTPWDRFLIGVEFLRGQREDKNRKNGTDSRIQFTTRYYF